MNTFIQIQIRLQPEQHKKMKEFTRIQEELTDYRRNLIVEVGNERGIDNFRVREN